MTPSLGTEPESHWLKAISFQHLRKTYPHAGSDMSMPSQAIILHVGFQEDMLLKDKNRYSLNKDLIQPLKN